MKKLRALFHPIAILISAQIAWGLLMFVWIRWYVLRSQEVEDLVKTMGPSQLSRSANSFILIQGCVLMGLILIGIYVLFITNRKQWALNKLQRNILDSVTHELKTPLASLRLHTETLLFRPVNDETRTNFLKKSIQEIERLQSLIEGILVSARVEGGIEDIEKNEIDLQAVVENCYSHFRERLGSRRLFSLYVSNNTPQNPFEIRASKQEMEMVFNNLLENAVKYSPEGGSVSVEVRIDSQQFQVSIFNSGNGIEQSEINKIFKKFYRASSHHRNHVSGTGLGLFVCRTVVKNHGGRIYATSPGLNKGATFHVEFKRTSRTH